MTEKQQMRLAAKICESLNGLNFNQAQLVVKSAMSMFRESIAIDPSSNLFLEVSQRWIESASDDY